MPAPCNSEMGVHLKEEEEEKEEEKEEEVFNHYKNDLKRHAHTLSCDAARTCSRDRAEP